MTPDGRQSHGRSQIEDHPVTVGLSMSWVCLDSIDVKVLFEIGSVVLAEVSQWVIMGDYSYRTQRLVLVPR
jgi:hypothetical protein